MDSRQPPCVAGLHRIGSVSALLHIAAYRFVVIDDPEALRESVALRAAALELRGSVLLAAEGINLFLAGTPAAVHEFLGWLRSDPRFAGLRAFESRAERMPFARLQVKVKPEIIRMNRPAVRPQAGRADCIDASTLAAWLDRGCDDEGRPLTLLDTRNGFEVDQGRFRGAIDWRIASFGEFPAAAARRQAELQGTTVVTYCTGGIRCEKAALLLAESGAEKVLQLDGGILGYLQQVGARHFDGSCFVFDARGAIDAAAAAPFPAGAHPACAA